MSHHISRWLHRKTTKTNPWQNRPVWGKVAIDAPHATAASSSPASTHAS
jgi:hypothetical protein